MESTLPGTAATTNSSAMRRRRAVWAVRLTVGALVAFLIVEIVHVTLGRNSHTLIPGEIYRSAQLSPEQLDAAIKSHGIRTVVNLRGRMDGADWYDAEARACQAAGVSLENIAFSASRVPSKHEARRLIDVLDRAERPLLLHCRQGADRTGLASAATMLLMPDVPYSTARAKMGLRWGHWKWGPAGELSRFFTLYEKHLADHRIEHSPERFRNWVMHEYQGVSEFEVVEVSPSEPDFRANRPNQLRVQLRNVGASSWEFHSFSRAGIHLQAVLTDGDGQVRGGALAGLFEKSVPPNGQIELTLAFGPVPAGRYRLRADLHFGEQGPFSKFGQEPIERELIVRD